MESESSLLYSQEPVTCPCPEPQLQCRKTFHNEQVRNTFNHV